MSDQVLAAIEAAHEEVVRLCAPGERWRMSVPANEDRDSDLVITKALVYARAYIQAMKPPPIPPDHACDERCDHLGEWLGGGAR